MEALIAKFADSLGLSPGIDAPAPKMVTSEALDSVEEIMKDLNVDVERRFWTKLTAEYLPSLLKSFVSSPVDLHSTLDRRAFFRYVWFLGSGCPPSLPYWRRFVREHPDEAVAYHLFLLQATLELPESLLTPSCSHLVTAIATSRVNLVVAYPRPSIPVPTLSDIEKTAIRRVADCLPYHTPSARGHLDDEMRQVFAGLPQELSRLGSLDLDTARRETETPLGWWCCEWGKTESLKGTPVEPCVQLADDEEMMACSRCLTVRYCSKDHQRLHWKEHKKYCFKSSW